MKKLCSLLLVAIFTLVCLSAFAPEGSATDNSKLKPDVMNCKPGMYKTYDEFIHNHPHEWKWVDVEVGYTLGMKYSKYNVVFKDEGGQKQKLAPADFWGWRDPNGILYRNSAFANGKITAIPFSVRYVAKDFVMYHPATFTGGNPNGIEILPEQWCSTDLNSPIVDSREYFKQHDKNALNKITAAMGDCAKKKDKDLYDHQTPDNLVAPDNEMRTCLKTCPEIISIWIYDKQSALSKMAVGEREVNGSYQK